MNLTDEKPAVLRRGNLDARDRAILSTVWEYTQYRGQQPSWRDLISATGISMGGLRHRINGTCGGLIGSGWLCIAPDIARTLRPGPRFAAYERAAKWPLEWA